MSAHPAGSRHELPHAPSLADKPSDPQSLIALPEAVWPRHARRGPDGVVTVAGVSVADLAAQYGTPLFILDEDDFRSRCREMAAAFGGGDYVHYASKAFLCSEIARWVRDEGLRLDVASGGELELSLRAEFPAARITLHGNNKSTAELERAVGAGVGHIVVDSLDEIARLDTLAAAAGVVQDVLVRVTVGVEAHTHEFIATAHEDQKFGFSLAGGAAMEAVNAIFAAEHIKLIGLHSHIGSQIFDVAGFELAAHRVLGLLKQIVEAYGVERTAQISHLDLGGGLGISYVESDDPPPLAELAGSLREIVRRESTAMGLPVPELAVEPGRAIAGPGTITVYEVGTLKDVALPNGNSRRYVSVDGGMSDNIRPALYDAVYDCRLVSRASTAAPLVSRVVGKHCESGDVLVRDLWLQEDVAAGDLLAVAATGAYCYSMSSRYNLLGRPPVVAVKDGKSRLILRRETIADLTSLEA